MAVFFIQNLLKAYYLKLYFSTIFLVVVPYLHSQHFCSLDITFSYPLPRKAAWYFSDDLKHWLVHNFIFTSTSDHALTEHLCLLYSSYICPEHCLFLLLHYAISNPLAPWGQEMCHSYFSSRGTLTVWSIVALSVFAELSWKCKCINAGLEAKPTHQKVNELVCPLLLLPFLDTKTGTCTDCMLRFSSKFTSYCQWNWRVPGWMDYIQKSWSKEVNIRLILERNYLFKTLSFHHKENYPFIKCQNKHALN